MGYRRVLPRDLFNEAKLLKCLGQLALILHDFEGRYPLKIIHSRPDDGFRILQDASSGNIYCSNLKVINTKKKRFIHLSTGLNSRDLWPLQYDDDTESEWYGNGWVFNNQGIFSDDFLLYLGMNNEQATSG